MNVARIASGIDTPMMNVLRSDLRNSSTTNIASSAPPSAASRTDASASRMNPDWSKVTACLMSSGMKPLVSRRLMARSTPSTTSTVFASGCLRIETRTACAPSSRAHDRCSALVSRIVAISVSGMRDPDDPESRMPRMSSTLRNFPAVLPTTSRVAEAMRPAEMSWFSLRSDVMICESDSPCVRNRSWSTSIWISRTRPPEMSMDATPGTESSCGRRR